MAAEASFSDDEIGRPSVEELSDADLLHQIREATGNDRLADLWGATLKHSRGEDIAEDLNRIEANLRTAVALLLPVGAARR